MEGAGGWGEFLCFPQKMGTRKDSAGLGYYYFSNAINDHNTAQKTSLQLMRDSNTFFYVMPAFS